MLIEYLNLFFLKTQEFQLSLYSRVTGHFGGKRGGGTYCIPLGVFSHPLLSFIFIYTFFFFFFVFYNLY